LQDNEEVIIIIIVEDLKVVDGNKNDYGEKKQKNMTRARGLLSSKYNYCLISLLSNLLD
jgi:hypothetical protein